MVIGQEPASAPPGTVDRRTELQHLILARLPDDPDNSVRRSVAGNPHTPSGVLARLADDPDTSVRRSVAGNPHTPLPVLVRLADDPDHHVRITVAGNPATPMTALEQMAASLEAEHRQPEDQSCAQLRQDEPSH